jgi:hypothetical protein
MRRRSRAAKPSSRRVPSLRPILRFKNLSIAAAALSIAGIAWFAVGHLLQPGGQTRQTAVVSDSACDYAFEERATEAWLADAFDLAQVPGDSTIPPLERMRADDRNVFVPAYHAGSYRAQIDAIREGTLMVVPGEPRQPLNEINWSEAAFGEYYATKLHGWSGLARLLGSPDRLPEDVENAIAFVTRDWFRCDGLPPGVSPRVGGKGRW